MTLSIRDFAGLAFGLAGAAAGALPLRAEPVCAPRDQVLAQLATRYGEERRAVGLVGERRIMELFAARDGESWTIIVTDPEGRSCLLASGSVLTDLAPPPGLPAGYAGSDKGIMDQL